MRTIILLFTLVSFTALAQDLDFSNFELAELGKEVNTPYHESAPIISTDGNTLYFFRADHPENKYGKEFSQDIWYSEKDEYGRWKKAIHAPAPLNNHRYNQVFSVLDDGTVLLRGGSGKKSDGFSLSKNLNGRFTDITEQLVKDYDKMNKGKFSGACLSRDGKVMILYFNEKEGAKYSDLYVSFSEGANKWSRPQKLPNSINTTLDEFGPYIAPDNETMFFAAVRSGGYGNADIYYTKRLDDTWLNWSSPVNAGPTINTNGFDAYCSMDDKGNIFVTRAFMSPVGGSLDILGLKPKDPVILMNARIINKKTGEPIMGEYTYKYKGNDPLPWIVRYGEFTDSLPGKGKYRIMVRAEGFASMEEDYNIKKVVNDTVVEKTFALLPVESRIFVKGVVANVKTSEHISARVTLMQEAQQLAGTQAEGRFLLTLTQAGQFTIAAQAEGFLNDQQALDASHAKAGDTLHVNFNLSPIEVGTTVRLNNIFFDFNAASLRPESFPELDKVVAFLVENRNITIEIGGHTDGQGSDDYNLRLSQGRAESVRSYLISEGIPSGRISAKGYGKSVPIASNDTEEGRQENRRVEFKVLEM